MNATEYAKQSPSYRRGFVAGQQGDVDFARLVEGADDHEEAMRGFDDGLKSITEEEPQ